MKLILFGIALILLSFWGALYAPDSREIMIGCGFVLPIIGLIFCLVGLFKKEDDF